MKKVMPRLNAMPLLYFFLYLIALRLELNMVSAALESRIKISRAAACRPSAMEWAVADFRKAVCGCCAGLKK